MEGLDTYAKIFNQIFDSSIAEDFTTRHIFTDLIILADEKGIVDMTLHAISRRINVPESLVSVAIGRLMQPDPASRSKEEDGRRLILVDPPREWGWLIVNYEKYRNTKTKEDKRLYDRGRYEQKKKAEIPQIPPSSLFSLSSTDSTHASASASASVFKEVKKEKKDFDPEVRFQSYKSKHPGVKTRVGDCRSAYMRYVLESNDPESLADSMDQKQGRWLEYWSTARAQPLGLYNFLAAGDCIEEPPQGGNVSDCMRGV